MATAAGCVLQRSLNRSGTSPGSKTSSSPLVCRDILRVLDVQRYTRDQGSSVYFPQAVLSADDLYDVTLTDGDCRLQVTLDPGLNRLVETNVLQPGSTLRHATFAPAMAAQQPACTGDSYRLVSVELRDHDGVRGLDVDPDSLPWFGSSGPAGPGLPLRAVRSVYLPLWNNVDYTGEAWNQAPPTEAEPQGRRPAVTVSELRDSFLSGRGGVARGAIHRQLITRIVNKSHLMYYGKTDRNCECPYKMVLEVCDLTGSVCVVFWNSVCVSWYRFLKPGDVISLRRYRVKRNYLSEADDIEISVNSRNPTAQISLLPESSVSPRYLPPACHYNFYTSQELLERPHGTLCEVIGLLTFSGRQERIRSKDGRGVELLEYRWLRLEDGSCRQPIMVKLFSTSQPESQRDLYPLCVVVCTRLKLISDGSSCCFLTNTTNTQVYSSGHHSEMSYGKHWQVKHLRRWLRNQDEQQVLSRTLIGGYFMFPPPPVSLESYMNARRGQPAFLRGAELESEVDRLCYRERRTFCIQATVTMAMYSRRGEEDRCLFWTEPAPPPSSPRLPSSSLPPPPSTPRALGPPLSSPSLSPASPLIIRMSGKRRQQQLDTPNKRRPLVTSQPQPKNNSILFQASMEFLQNTDEEDDDSDGASSFVTAPLCPAFTPVAEETLPMRYNHARREEQAAAVAMGGRAEPGSFDSAFEDYYQLRLRALSDGGMVDVVFLPHSDSSAHAHANTWSSILSHGAFSSHQPPPSPADLIVMASQLTNRRLVCVMEACHLGGAKTEIVLSRAFHLPN